MKQKKLNLSEAFEAGEKLPYAMIRTLSSVYVGENRSMKNMEPLLDELEEARFFNDKTEIKILRKDTDLMAVQTDAEPSDHCLVKTYSIANPEFGKTLQVACDLGQDEDGQTYICGERLIGWEGI